MIPVLARLLAGVSSRWTPPREVRAEAWALGGRYRGRVVEGARRELCAPGLPLRRALLLQAVIRAETRT